VEKSEFFTKFNDAHAENVAREASCLDDLFVQQRLKFRGDGLVSLDKEKLR